MRDPEFWWRKPGIAARLLAPLGALYGLIAARRMQRDGAKAACPVICVGNPTHGGAGKTPTALAIARMLLAENERPAFLTRGYGGSLAGPVRVDPRRHHASEVGDEPLLLGKLAPTIVARDRHAGAAAACAAGCSAIIMDDGFQNPALVKDYALLVIDGRRGIGNGRVFPAGPLRAPWEPQIRRARSLVVIGSGPGADWALAEGRRSSLPVYRGELRPPAESLHALRPKRFLAFAGIGDPDKFFATIATAGLEAPVRRAFADHHRYTAADAREILGLADSQGLTPLTTEKDAARMSGDRATGELLGRAEVLPVHLVLEDAAAFKAALLAVVRRP